MADITGAKKLLDEINAAIASYDPTLKEHARDILLQEAFGNRPSAPNRHVAESGGIAGVDESMQFHQLVEKWTPETQADWALLAAYYCQVMLGKESISALEANNVLKQHGAIIANITRSFEEHISDSPALIRQIGKAGKTRQAKKRYVLTTNGIKAVEEKLNGSVEHQ